MACFEMCVCALRSAVSGGQRAEAASREEGASEAGDQQGPGRKQQLQQEDGGEAPAEDGEYQREPQCTSQRPEAAST